MIGKSINGNNECFVCGHEIHWETRITSTISKMVVQQLPEVTAEECAISRNEEGEITYEVKCVCPRCKTKNKFTVSRK